MRLRILGTILLGMALLTGCSSSGNGTSSDDTNEGVTDVRVGVFPNITHAQGLVGRANGEFQENLGDDYNVTWTSFNAGPAEIEAIFAGEIDMGYIGPVPAINGYTKSKRDVQIIAGATNGGAMLVSKKDEKFTSVAELDGKKVAIPQLGNTQHLSLLQLLSDNNLKTVSNGGTVEVVQAENADIKTLLDSGEIDAALVPEPWGTRLVEEIGANVVLDYDDLWLDGNYSTAVVVANKDFLEEHPDAVENFLQTHVELTEYINENKDEAIQIVNSQIEELTGKALADDIIKKAFDRLILTYEPASDSISQFIDLSLEEGLIQGCDDKENLFNLNMLNEVLDEKGLDQVKQ